MTEPHTDRDSHSQATDSVDIGLSSVAWIQEATYVIGRYRPSLRRQTSQAVQWSN